MKHNGALYNKYKNIMQIVGSEICVQRNFLTVRAPALTYAYSRTGVTRRVVEEKRIEIYKNR